MRLDHSHPSSCRIAAIICIILFFQYPFLFSQSESYRLEQIPYKGELSYFKGYCIMEDKEGFMWFGSNNGLYRYDGKEFKVFRHDPFDPWSISSDGILDLIEDSTDIMWVARSTGLDQYDKYTEQFHRCLTENIWLHTMIDDSTGNIWLGTQTGSLLKYDKESGALDTMVSTDLKQLHTGRGHRKLLMDRFGVLWIRGYDYQLYKFYAKTDSLVQIENVPCRMMSLLEDRSGRIWVTGECGLYFWDRGKEVFERQLYKVGDPNRLVDNRVGHILEDRFGNLWIRTCDGIYKYSHDLSLLFKLDDPLDCDGRIGYAYRLFEDQSGTIWFFNGNGINQLVREDESFTLFSPDQSTRNNSCVFLVNDDSLLYGCRYDNYYAYNRKSKLLKKNVLDSVYAMYVDSRGVFWVGTSHGLFRQIDSGSQIPEYIGYQPVVGDSSSLPGMHINYIFEDSGGRLWIGSRGGGPCYYDRLKDCFVHLVDDPHSPVKLTYETSIRHETDQGELLALNSGVFKVIPPFRKISDNAVVASEIIEFVPPKPTGHQLSNFYASYLGPEGMLWLGSEKMGLFCMDEEGLRSFLVRDGLPSNRINTIQEDNRGNLWLATTVGLSKFDLQSETFTNFIRFDGQIVDWFTKSSAKNSRGELFFATWDGLLSFHPDSIRLSTGAPIVKLTGFKVHNMDIIPSDSSILRKSIQFTDSVSLSHKQNTVTINFAVLNYIQPEKNQYKYMLEGLDEEWVFSGQRNSITYANLLPGNYVFRASGSNAEGIWNEEGASLSIHIAKPPWRMWWAYVCYVVFLSGIAVMTWRFLVGRAKMKTALELEKVELKKVLEMDQMKSRFFANISHEFRTPLTLLLGPIEDELKTGSPKIETERKIFKMMRRNAKRLLRLINQLLDMSRLETGMMRVHVSGGDLKVFIRTLASSFLSLAENKGITYSIELPEMESVCFFDPDKVEKILTNMLSNAFKYTPKGKSVTLQMEYQSSSAGSLNDTVLFRVTDSGRGIAKERIEKIFDRFSSLESSEKQEDESMGLGLAHTRELVHLLKGTVELESEIGMGTCITVILPVAESSFSKEERKVDDEPGEHVFNTGHEIGVVDLPDDRKEDNPPAGKGGPELVLIVEDNQDLRTYISHHLGEEFKTIEAVDGQEGFHQAIDVIPDLVISDIMMPVKNGIELCRELKNDPRTSHIPVILLTAKANRSSKLEGLDTGADDYMIKPFDATELLTRVRNLIIQRKKLRLKFRQEFPPGSAEETLLSPQDLLLQKIMDILQKNISDPDFKADKLSGELNMSKRQLYRKVSAVTGYTPNELMRQLRLKKSVLLFDSGEKNIARVMYEVGFNNQSYFTKCFRQQYQVNPSAYIKAKAARVM